MATTVATPCHSAVVHVAQLTAPGQCTDVSASDRVTNSTSTSCCETIGNSLVPIKRAHRSMLTEQLTNSVAYATCLWRRCLEGSVDTHPHTHRRTHWPQPGRSQGCTVLAWGDGIDPQVLSSRSGDAPKRQGKICSHCRMLIRGSCGGCGHRNRRPYSPCSHGHRCFHHLQHESTVCCLPGNVATA